MDQIYRDFLFSKGILVGNGHGDEESFGVIVTLGQQFAIRIKEGFGLASKDIVEDAARNMGINVPEPFYRGFPESVRELTNEQLLFDQMLEYFHTYGLGWFGEPSHSVIETINKVAFKEKTEPKDFVILSEEVAKKRFVAFIRDMLSSTRPLSPDNAALAIKAIRDTEFVWMDILPTRIHCKATLCWYVYEFKAAGTLHFLKMGLTLPDVIKLLDYISYSQYGNENLKKLNLRNQDRKLLTRLIDDLCSFADDDQFDEWRKECFEKRKIWCGLMHHLHFKGTNDRSKLFARMIRSKETKNDSAYHFFEESIATGDTYEAASFLQAKKGTSALLRNLDYLLSRSDIYTASSILGLLQNDKNLNPVVLIQLLLHYAEPDVKGPRTFSFNRNGRKRVHLETEEETTSRKTYISDKTRQVSFVPRIRQRLGNVLRERIGQSVYVDPDMVNIAIPLEAATGNSGYGILPTGSRVDIPKDKIVRAFTYWEKVNDIDLSCFVVDSEMNRLQEFSWRTIGRTIRTLNTAIAFSGDETSGYHGGSEYFDIDIDTLQKFYPKGKYLIFCDNIYSNSTFSQVECRAGFMLRERFSSGEVFEPKTVKTSYRMTADSNFGYLFAIDLENRQMIWLNLSQKESAHVAGESNMGFLRKYLHMVDDISLGSMFLMGATVASQDFNDIPEMDIIVTDRDVSAFKLKEGATVIRSSDTEKILKYLS